MENIFQNKTLDLQKNIKARKFLNCKAGFTLIELIVALGIFIVLITISGNFIMKGFQLKKQTYARLSATEEAQKVIRNMMHEIRNSTQSDSGDYNLATVSFQEFSFYSNVDDDENIEKVRYFLNGTDFMRGVIDPEGEPLEYLPENEVVNKVASYINNEEEAIFSYFDGDNNKVLSPSENISSIRLVRVVLKINPNFSQGGKDYVLTSDIQIRNLKDNL